MVFWGEVDLGEVGGEVKKLGVENLGGLRGEMGELEEAGEVWGDVGELEGVVGEGGVEEGDFGVEVGVLGV